jgi:choice-of-anchor A domain-containing protein
VLARSAFLVGLHCTQTFGDITTNTTITSTGGLNVICVNSINLTKKTLTLMGDFSGTDAFVINVTSPTADFILNGSHIVLSAGLTSDRVIFNFPGTGGSLQVYKASTVMNGTLLAPQRDIDINNPAVFGSVIG